MSRQKISVRMQQQIRERANHLCEYCHASEIWQYVRFTVDHIIPLSRDGANTLENLCLACFHCNRRKSWNIRGFDPDSGQEVLLFHPRQHAWNDHFAWSSDMLHIIGLTPAGNATIELLELNRERVVRIRAADLEAGRHPPADDKIQTEKENP